MRYVAGALKLEAEDRGEAAAVDAAVVQKLLAEMNIHPASEVDTWYVPTSETLSCWLTFSPCPGPAGCPSTP
jgi:hypothetical protein